MKKYRTKVYQLLAFFYLLFPASYLPGIVFLFDIPIEQGGAILAVPLYWVVSLFSIVVGYGLIQVRRWSWYLLRPVQFLILFLSALIAYRFSQTHYTWISFLVITLLIWLTDRRISRELRVPYFMPQIPWWESDRQFRTQIPSKVVRAAGKTLESEIIDLSLAGCFVKCKHEFYENETVEVHCELFGRQWVCKGIVVWVTFGAVTHPRGVGIKFGAMDRSTRRTLATSALKISKISRLNRRERYWLTAEAYQKKLEQLTAPLPKEEG